MNSHLISRLFPVPRFLEMPAVGIDISDAAIRFLELHRTAHGFAIGRFGSRKIPDGSVVGGSIQEPEALSRILAEIQHDFGFKFVRASLPEEKGYLFKLAAAAQSRDALRVSVESQLEENVPIPPSEAIYDYDIVSGSARGSIVDAVVSAIPQKTAEHYAAIFTNARLIPLSFEIEAQAIARSIVPQEDPGTYMIIDFGLNRTGLSVVSHGVVHLTSTLDIAGSSLTASIQKHLKISFEEAEEMKLDRGFLLDPEKDTEVFEAMISTIAALRDEVNKHYVYWHTQEDPYGRKGEPILKIYLCGGDANLKGLIEYLSITMRAKVELANVWTNVAHFDEYIPPITAADSMRYATAVGLALRTTD